MSGNRDWGVQGGSLTLPPFAGPDDPAILVGDFLPPCMQASYTAAIFFRPPNSVIDRAPYWFLAQRTLPIGGTSWQDVDEGYLIYDGAACGYVIYRRRQGHYQLFGPDMVIDAFEDFGNIEENGALFNSPPQAGFSNGAIINILDPATFFINVNIDWNGCITAQSIDVTSYTNGSVGYTATGPTAFVGNAFTVPPSGQVMIHYGGRMSNNSAGQSTYLSIAILTGGTVGSGSTVLAASDNNATDTAGNANQSQRQSVQYLFTGTPGDVLNATLMHRVQGGTGTFSRRYVITQPVF